jgi:hypothetical protein
MKFIKHAGIKTKTTIFTVIPVVVSIVIICSVLLMSLFNTQQETAKALFLHLGSKYTGIFENKVNSAIDYLSVVEGIVEFHASEGITDRVYLQKTLLNLFNNYPSVRTSVIQFEPNAYDGRDRAYAGTQYGESDSGEIIFVFF